MALPQATSTIEDTLGLPPREAQVHAGHASVATAARPADESAQQAATVGPSCDKPRNMLDFSAEEITTYAELGLAQSGAWRGPTIPSSTPSSLKA